MKTALLHPRRSAPTGSEPPTPSDGAIPPAPGPAALAAEHAHSENALPPEPSHARVRPPEAASVTAKTVTAKTVPTETVPPGAVPTGAVPPGAGPTETALAGAASARSTLSETERPEKEHSKSELSESELLDAESARGEPRWLASVATVLQSGPVPELQPVLLDIIVNPQVPPAEPVVVIHSDEHGEHLVLTPESARRLGSVLTTLFPDDESRAAPLPPADHTEPPPGRVR